MASKKNQEQSALNKMMREEIALREKEKSLQNELVNMAKARYKISNDAKQTQQDLAKALAESKSTEESIQSIQEAKDKLLEEAISKGKEINSHYYDMLDTRQKLLEKLKEEEELQAEIEETTKAAKEELMGSLGTLGEMLKAGTALGAAMALFKGLTEGIGKAFQNTIGFASDLNKELGISGAQAAELGMQNFSTDVLFSRFSVEQLNQATRDLATTFGTAAGISNDLRESVAEITAMGVGGEDAAKLSQMLETAGGSAGDMTEEIKQMAQDAGVMAGTTFKDLAAQQKLMLGMTKEEIRELTKKTIELNKQGLTLSDMQSISEKMMDIEGTMKAQAKARVLLQGKLTEEQMAGMEGMTAAAMEFQNTGNTDALTESLKKAGMTAEQFNKLGPRGQALYADSIGMTSDRLMEVIQQNEQMAKAAEAGPLEKAGSKAMEIWQSTPDFIKEATTGLIAFIAQMSIMNLMQGKGTGLSNLNPFKKKGGGGGDVTSDVASTNDGGGDMGNASQGAGGGLKSLAEGLKEMGDGKVFAGIGAVALAGPAFIIALPAIPFLLFMGKVKLKALEENFSGLATGLNSMASTFMGSLAVGAFAIAAIPSILSIPFLLFMGLTPLQQLAPNFTSLSAGLTAMASTFMGSLALGAFAVAAALGIASIPFLIAISLLGIAASAGLSALGVGLTALGTAAASGLPFLGIALIGALGLAMIPFAIALNIATPAIEAFGGVIVGVMGAIPPIIGAIADGFVTMLGAITPEAIAGLMLLGPALLMASVGMLAFSASLLVGAFASWFGGGLVDQIVLLGTVGPGVKEAGEGLALVADNMSLLTENLSGVSSLVTPMYALAGGLAAFAGSVAIGSIFGGGIVETIRQLSELGPGMVQTGNALDTISSTIGTLSSNIDVLSESMQKVAEVSGELWGVSGALLGIAGGLTAISFAGLLAIPTFAALGGLAAIAPTLMSLGDFFGFGGEGESDNSTTNTTDNSNKELLEEIKGLRNDIKGQPIVLNIDGKAVSRIQRVGRQQSNNRGAYQSL